MKDAVKYSRIWNKKRNELKIDDNIDQDWLEMQAKLNLHLPNTPSAQPDFKGLKYLKAWLVVAVSLVTVLAIYYYGSKNNAKQVKKQLSQQQNKTDSAIQPLSDTANYQKSTPAEQQQVTAATDSFNNKQQSLAKATHTQTAPAITTANNSKGIKGNATLTSSPTSNPANHQAANTRGASQMADAQSGKNVFTKNNVIATSRSVLNSAVSNTVTTKNGSLTQAAATENNNIRNDQNNNNNLERTAGTADGSGKAPTIVQPSSSPAASPGNAGNNQQLNSAINTNKPGITAKPEKDKSKKDKTKQVKKPANTGPSNIDWGILAGVNTAGSFTGKSQNNNIYGSLPVDIYAGLFATYHLQGNWAIGAQVKLLNPQTISGSYTHANGSKVDSGKILQVNDSRKAYFITIPLHAVYKITDQLSLKGGPVINIPVKQVGGNTKLSPQTIQRDTVYYTKTINQLNATRYQQQINFGVSGGVSLQLNRLNVEATYQKSVSGYNVASGFGSYKSNNGSLQFTIGFKLNK